MNSLSPITLSECLRKFRSDLRPVYDGSELEQVIAMVFEKVLGLSRAQLTIGKDMPVSPAAYRTLEEILARLQTHEPVQYVLGEAWFLGMKLIVNKHVLIPRPETEELTEWVMEELKTVSGHPRILDACTGSGCIALALKNNFPAAQVSATDISKDALDVAARNAESLGLQVHFRLEDVLHQEKNGESGLFDFIVSNPPYIGESEAQEMAPRVRDFEPLKALFTGDDDVLGFYKALADYASGQLAAGGSLYFEINSRYGQEVCDLLVQEGFKKVVLKKDLSGADRLVKAKSPNFEV